MAKQYISKEINNLAYAPGIATYGGTGLPGETGEAGNCIFFTSFNINAGEDLQDFKSALRDNRLPIKNGEAVARTFKNGDYFFDTSGNIYVLYDIDKFLSYPITSDNYSTYLTLVGKIKSTNDANALFSRDIANGTNRVSLNQTFYGVDINTTAFNLNDNTNHYALRIYADNTTNTSNTVEVLHATGFFNYSTQSELKIYYDADLGIWHIATETNGKNIPIVIDSELTVNTQQTDTLLDDYSSVITTPTPITSFYNYAKDITYTFNKNVLSFSALLPVKLQEYTQVKCVTKGANDTTAQYLVPYSQIIKKDGVLFDSAKVNANNILSISFIHNIEIYLKEE